MSRKIMLIPTDMNVGLTSVSLGLIRLIEKKGISISVFQPMVQPLLGSQQQLTEVFRSSYNVKVAEPLTRSYVKYLLANNLNNQLMEDIIARYHDKTPQADITVIEGLIPTSQYNFAPLLNYEIAKALAADVVLVITLGNNTPEQLKERLELVSAEFGGVKNNNLIGVIINKLNAPVYEQGIILPDLSAELFAESTPATIATKRYAPQLTNNIPLPILGCIPWNGDLIAPRGIDIANHLNATILNEGALKTRRIKSVILCACHLPNLVELFRPGSLLVTSSDRHDVIVSACLAAMNGIELGALLLTDGYALTKPIAKICQRALNNGLPVLMVDTNTWQTSLSLQSLSLEVHADDHDQINKIQNYVAMHINNKWSDSLTTDYKVDKRLSPPAFRYKLTTLARKAKKRIVLPEGNGANIVKAAAICAERGLATCLLLGDIAEIQLVAAAQGVKLGAGIEIIAPTLIRQNYVERLVALRKHKGMTEIMARKQLEDNVVLGTMMLENNEVDGLVSGAVNTTANTIRPPLQLIKTVPGSSLVSSIFFMLFPEQVLVYGDCAINTDPTAEQLAEIAIQSADSAKAFGIEPIVAMISYSTGHSGTGSHVEKVRKATYLVQSKRPDLVIDGPLQYDAAIIANVAKLKAPNSPVAGKATVLIFPDLNTGNTTYKAVQRSAHIISIGPMLQGMRKPVNDLSRGALVDDIVYTIALTAIQATNNKQITIP